MDRNAKKIEITSNHNVIHAAALHRATARFDGCDYGENYYLLDHPSEIVPNPSDDAHLEATLGREPSTSERDHFADALRVEWVEIVRKDRESYEAEKAAELAAKERAVEARAARDRRVAPVNAKIAAAFAKADAMGLPIASYTKLKDGRWGLMGKNLRTTFCSYVKTRSGKVKMELVGRIFWRGSDGTQIAEIDEGNTAFMAMMGIRLDTGDNLGDLLAIVESCEHAA